ncbi:hypothetical protein TvY486_0019630 [Trypanosoma vivax Y486]|uniref:Uncharacterized protein n=1 Tax=Trypanosoma vivax (strain Y486) TaxID=1055687 RepID=F9WP01_TRYVY|nr:hypothetical protein TvY486_0019630 [Trypanosoma vivax Y486]|eukprot:CCD19273.1 hypothetical protein TvY486_0019630 [Trypanosoma vivax Y486]
MMQKRTHFPRVLHSMPISKSFVLFSPARLQDKSSILSTASRLNASNCPCSSATFPLSYRFRLDGPCSATLTTERDIPVLLPLFATLFSHAASQTASRTQPLFCVSLNAVVPHVLHTARTAERAVSPTVDIIGLPVVHHDKTPHGGARVLKPDGNEAGAQAAFFPIPPGCPCCRCSSHRSCAPCRLSLFLCTVVLGLLRPVFTARSRELSPLRTPCVLHLRPP